MHISVVTICTREKLYSHPRQLTRRDFAELTRRLWREDELGHLRVPAGRLYTGLPMRRLGSGIGLARRARHRVDLWVVSAGYGLIPEQLSVVPYDCSFNGLSAPRLREWADHLCLPDSATMLLEGRADLRLVLLTDPYLRACQLKADTPLGAPTVFVCSRRMAGRLPAEARVWVLEQADVGRYGTPAVALRQQVGALVLELLGREGDAGLARVLGCGEGWRGPLQAPV